MMHTSNTEEGWLGGTEAGMRPRHGTLKKVVGHGSSAQAGY